MNYPPPDQPNDNGDTPRDQEPQPPSGQPPQGGESHGTPQRPDGGEEQTGEAREPYREPQQPYGQPPQGQPPYGGSQQPYGQPPPSGQGYPGQQPPYGQQPYGGTPQDPYATPGGYGAPPPPQPYGQPTEGPSVHGRPLAEWWQRLVARIIDGIVVVVPFFIIAFIVGLFYAAALVREGETELQIGTGADLTLTLVLSLVLLAIGLAYEVFMLTRYGRTLGKMAFSLRVISLDNPLQQSGGLPSNTALIRSLVWYGPAILAWIPFIGTIANLIPIINGLWPLWDRPNRQSLNDKAAKTVVVLDHP
ncbi:RDD family protein [Nocardiopsis rhodophaea]|uniref:RDD family protein n=1 Tax=Nocardiopsis rhodophaea TaxID=280238 RepID=UPI0031D61BBB